MIRNRNEPNMQVCPGSATVRGIDVSGYDPHTDWIKVSSLGIKFAFIKATEGTGYINPNFTRDWSLAPKAGVLVGAYHFFRPGYDGVAQAKHFLGTLGSRRPGDLPCVIDWEVSDHISTNTNINRAADFCNTVTKAGFKIIVYCAPSFYNEVGNPSFFAPYPLWIANYGVKCPKVPPPWDNWTFWQTGEGHLDGVNNDKADLNLFNGTLDQLKVLASY